VPETLSFWLRRDRPTTSPPRRAEHEGEDLGYGGIEGLRDLLADLDVAVERSGEWGIRDDGDVVFGGRLADGVAMRSAPFATTSGASFLPS